MNPFPRECTAVRVVRRFTLGHIYKMFALMIRGCHRLVSNSPPHCQCRARLSREQLDKQNAPNSPRIRQEKEARLVVVATNSFYKQLPLQHQPVCPKAKNRPNSLASSA